MATPYDPDTEENMTDEDAEGETDEEVSAEDEEDAEGSGDDEEADGMDVDEQEVDSEGEELPSHKEVELHSQQKGASSAAAKKAAEDIVDQVHSYSLLECSLIGLYDFSLITPSYHGIGYLFLLRKRGQGSLAISVLPISLQSYPRAILSGSGPMQRRFSLRGRDLA